MHSLIASLVLLQNENQNPYGGAAFGAFMVGYVIFLLIIVILAIVIYWRIFAKAGWAGALSLLMIIPLVNFILLIAFAFSEWPIERELKVLRGGSRAPTM
jgi:hypothetical protein